MRRAGEGNSQSRGRGPRAIIATAIIVGIFFVFTTFIVVIGFGDNASKLGGSAAPLNDLTSQVAGWVSTFIYFAATISCFACSLGQLTAFARTLFSLGRYPFVYNSMGVVHKHPGTPHLAIGAG